nr:bacteriophage protein [Raoultella sp. NCTC 9187]
MAKLPDASDIGRRIPQVAGGVASADTTQVARAMQGLGQVITSTAGEEYEEQQRLAIGNAQTAYNKAYADAKESFRNDDDYATMPDRYSEMMQKATDNAAAGITSGRGRQIFDAWAQQQNINGLSGIRDLSWSKEKDNNRASILKNAETLGNTYMSSTDPAQRQQSLDALNNMLDGATTKGYIDHTERQQWGQKWITSTAVGSLNMMQPEQRLSALRNPQGITTFLPPDQRQAMIKDASYEALNTRLGQQQLQMYAGDAGMNVLAVPQDTLMQAVYQQESGDRHRNADGSLVTSPKGAQGVGQIMPATGRDPGFGIKPLQDDSEQENRRMSGDYLGAMLKRYNGNQILALAAYNAGFGKVDNWIKQIGDPRTGQVSNEQFAASIPVNETRKLCLFRFGERPAYGERPFRHGLAGVQKIWTGSSRLR